MLQCSKLNFFLKRAVVRVVVHETNNQSLGEVTKEDTLFRPAQVTPGNRKLFYFHTSQGYFAGTLQSFNQGKLHSVAWLLFDKKLQRISI